MAVCGLPVAMSKTCEAIRNDCPMQCRREGLRGTPAASGTAL